MSILRCLLFPHDEEVDLMVFRQWKALDIILRTEPCSLTNQEMAWCLDSGVETTRKVLQSLRRKGLVQSKLTIRDRQVHQELALTADGLQVHHAYPDFLRREEEMFYE